MLIKNIFKISIVLFFLQLARVLFKSAVFSFIDRTLTADVIINCIFTSGALIICLAFFKARNLKIGFLPENFNLKYKACTALLLIFIITTPIITKNISFYAILSLIYNAILTVLYEEIIFRGYVYSKISSIKNEKYACLCSSILFGVWHLGYIDTILWRTSMFSPDADIPSIMFWKTLTGLIIGFILVFFRYKNKNVYSSVLVHSFINAFGG